MNIWHDIDEERISPKKSKPQKEAKPKVYKQPKSKKVEEDYWDSINAGED